MPSAFPRRALWTLVSLLLLGVGAWRLAGAGRFAFDVNQHAGAVVGHTEFGRTHCCLTCYVLAAHLVTTGEQNPYDKAHYEEEPRDRTPIHAQIGGRFQIDDFPYPPPLLVVHRLLLGLGLDFFAIRALWFVAMALCFLGGLLGLAWWAGAFRAQPELRLLSILVAATGPLLTLQIGNVQPAVLAATWLALVAAEAKRPWLAGALLAFGAVVKIWPLVFVLVWLLQRRFAALRALLGFCLLYLAISVAVLGFDVHRVFVTYQLPRLDDGSAFWFMTRPRAMAVNLAFAGVPHKLAALGWISGDLPLLQPWLQHLASALVLGAAVVVGIRLHRAAADAGDAARVHRARLWLALMLFAQLRSPFLPWDYGQITPLVLLVFLLPGRGRWATGLLLLPLALFALTMPDAPQLRAWLTLAALPVVVGIGIAGLAARRPAGA